jgi:2,3-bisphosphoglycerate-dependent phosphoglycerate mutase
MLYLIRHGETTLNVARIVQPADTPLSERGEAQAAALSRRLAAVGLAGILSSDLPRARQTAARIAAATGLPVTHTALLQERNFGALRGLAYDELASNPLAMDEAPPEGESRAQFEQRVAAAFAQALRLQAALGGPLAVVTHGLVVRAMLERHARLGAEQRLSAGLRNASLCIVAAAAPHAVALLDCTAHLDADIAHAAGSLSGG